MAFIVKRKQNGNIYYYIQESKKINGKTVTRAKYLGKAADIGDQLTRYREMLANDSLSITVPDDSTAYKFADVSALLDIADRNNIREIIDKYATKREQGLTVGDYMVLAAINRATEPGSKNCFHEWFSRTTLRSVFPNADSNNLSSQAFWNHMTTLDEKKIRAIEDEISRTIVQNYDINTDCLLFDNTNFFTYIDTDNPSKLAQRGNSKEKRSDLKIAGLSLMVSPDYNVPLFHKVYPGNTNDAKRFGEILESMKKRCAGFKKTTNDNENNVTLVFDRGNNSEKNILALIEEQPVSFHFVGGLKRNQFPELIELRKDQFTSLDSKMFKETSACRTTKEVFKGEYTVVVTDNPDLYKAQLRGVKNNIKKCEEKLKDLQEKLLQRFDGKSVKGKKYTVESVETKIKSILSSEHMKSVFDYTINAPTEQHVCLSFCLNQKKFEELREKILGKSILFTNHHDWSNERIIGAYRAQFHVEECFKRMKDRKHLSFRPVFHHTDNNIRVHGFYCVLALTLCNLMNLELEKLGYKMSLNKMLNTFGDVTQSVVGFRINKKIIDKVTFPREIPKQVDDYMKKFNLKKYALK